MKSSFRRYCRNKGIQTAEIQENTQIGTAIEQIDNFISQAKVGAESINESSMMMLVSGKISMEKFQSVKSLTTNIFELVDKHGSMKWYLYDVE